MQMRSALTSRASTPGKASTGSTSHGSPRVRQTLAAITSGPRFGPSPASSTPTINPPGPPGGGGLVANRRTAGRRTGRSFRPPQACRRGGRRRRSRRTRVRGGRPVGGARAGRHPPQSQPPTPTRPAVRRPRRSRGDVRQRDRHFDPPFARVVGASRRPRGRRATAQSGFQVASPQQSSRRRRRPRRSSGSRRCRSRGRRPTRSPTDRAAGSVRRGRGRPCSPAGGGKRASIGREAARNSQRASRAVITSPPRLRPAASVSGAASASRQQSSENAPSSRGVPGANPQGSSASDPSSASTAVAGEVGGVGRPN